jgi:hypothetical protein
MNSGIQKRITRFLNHCRHGSETEWLFGFPEFRPLYGAGGNA